MHCNMFDFKTRAAQRAFNKFGFFVHFQYSALIFRCLIRIWIASALLRKILHTKIPLCSLEKKRKFKGQRRYLDIESRGSL